MPPPSKKRRARPEEMTAEELRAAIQDFKDKKLAAQREKAQIANDQQNAKEQGAKLREESTQLHSEMSELSSQRKQVDGKVASAKRSGGALATAFNEMEGLQNKKIMLKQKLSAQRRRRKRMEQQNDKDGGGLSDVGKIQTKLDSYRIELQKLDLKEITLKSNQDRYDSLAKRIQETDRKTKQDESRVSQVKRELLEATQNLTLEEKRLEGNQAKYERYRMDIVDKEVRLKDDTQRLRDEKNNAETEIKSMLTEAELIRSEDADYGNVEAQFEALKAEKLQLQREKFILQTQAEVERRSGELVEKRTALEDRIQAIEKQFALLEQAKSTLKDGDREQIDVLQGNLRDEKDKLKGKLQKIGLREERVNKQKIELKEYQDRLVEQMVQEDPIVARAEDGTLKDRVMLGSASATLKREVEGLKMERSRIDAQKHRFSSASTELSFALQSVAQEKLKVQELGAELEDAKEEYNRLKDKWADISDEDKRRSKEFESMKGTVLKDNAALRAESTQLTREQKSFEHKIQLMRAQVESQRKQQDDAELALASFEAEKMTKRTGLLKSRSTLAYEKQTLESEQEKIQLKRKSLEEKTEALREVQTKLQERRFDVEQDQKTLAKQQKKVRETGKILSDTRTKLDSDKALIEETSHAIKMLQESPAKQREMAEMLREAQLDFQSRTQSEQSEFAVLKRELEAVCKRLKEDKTEFAEDKTRMSETRKALKRKAQSLQDERAQLLELKAEIEDMTKALHAVQAEMAREALELEDSRDAAKRLSDDLHAKIKNFASFRDAKRDMDNRKKGIEQDRANVKIQRLEATGELRKFSLQLKTLKKNMGILLNNHLDLNTKSTELGKKDSDNTAKRAELDKEQQKIEAENENISYERLRVNELEQNVARLKAEVDEQRALLELEKPLDEIDRIAEKIKKPDAYVSIRGLQVKHRKAPDPLEKTLETLRMQVETERTRLDQTARDLGMRKEDLETATENIGDLRQSLTRHKMKLENQKEEVSLARKNFEQERESLQTLKALIEEKKDIEQQKLEIKELIEAVERDQVDITRERDRLDAKIKEIGADESIGEDGSNIARVLQQLAHEKRKIGDQKKELMTTIQKVAAEKQEHEKQKQELHRLKAIEDGRRDKFEAERRRFLTLRNSFHEENLSAQRLSEDIERKRQKWTRDQAALQYEQANWRVEEEKVNDLVEKLEGDRNDLNKKRAEMRANLGKEISEVMHKIDSLVPRGVDVRTKEEKVHYRVTGAGASDSCGVYYESEQSTKDNPIYEKDMAADGKVFQMFKFVEQGPDGEDVTTWYITYSPSASGKGEHLDDVDYYKVESDSATPPDYSWEPCGHTPGPAPSIEMMDPNRPVVDFEKDDDEEDITASVADVERKQMLKAEEKLIENLDSMNKQFLKIRDAYFKTWREKERFEEEYSELVDAQFELDEKTSTYRADTRALKNAEMIAKWREAARQRSVRGRGDSDSDNYNSSEVDKILSGALYRSGTDPEPSS